MHLPLAFLTGTGLLWSAIGFGLIFGFLLHRGGVTDFNVIVRLFQFRDFTVLSGFLLQLWLYVTPVIIPLAKVPAEYHFIVGLNPVTMPVECMRYLLLGQGWVNPSLLAISVLVTLVTVVSGILVFRKVERTFVDVV